MIAHQLRILRDPGSTPGQFPEGTLKIVLIEKGLWEFRQVEADAYLLDHLLGGRLATPVILATENATCWSQGKAKTTAHIYQICAVIALRAMSTIGADWRGNSKAINVTMICLFKDNGCIWGYIAIMLL